MQANQMTTHELNALEEVVKHIMQNERTSYEECLQENGEGAGHIYAYAETLNNFLNGASHA